MLSIHLVYEGGDSSTKGEIRLRIGGDSSMEGLLFYRGRDLSTEGRTRLWRGYSSTEGETCLRRGGLVYGGGDSCLQPVKSCPFMYPLVQNRKHFPFM